MQVQFFGVDCVLPSLGTAECLPTRWLDFICIAYGKHASFAEPSWVFWTAVILKSLALPEIVLKLVLRGLG